MKEELLLKIRKQLPDFLWNENIFQEEKNKYKECYPEEEITEEFILNDIAETLAFNNLLPILEKIAEKY